MLAPSSHHGPGARHHQRLNWCSLYPATLQNQYASAGRCRRPGEGILEGVSTPRVIIGLRTIRHNLLRLLERADQTAVLAINENDSFSTLRLI